MVYRKFTQTFDVNTEVGSPTLLGIHTPIGGDVWRFLAPFFFAYKKYKYEGCDVTIVNSARLPTDPAQMGMEEGQNYVDPRDTLNPMMFKGCHGEALGDILNSMYGGLTSDAFRMTAMDKEVLSGVFEGFYYTAMGDDAWRKSPIQKTLRIKGLHPLVYGLSSTHQIAPTNAIEPNEYAENTRGQTSSSPTIKDVSDITVDGGTSPNLRGSLTEKLTVVSDVVNGTSVSKFVGNFLTNKCQRLGWMDTLQFLGSNHYDGKALEGQIALLPKLFMGLLMLPPAYLQRQYLRIVITHKFRFSQYRTVTTGGNIMTNLNVNSPIGYGNFMTGNVPNAQASVVGSEKAEALGSDTEAVDYDAIEEVDE